MRGNGQVKPYDPADDFPKSIDEAYRVIRERSGRRAGHHDRAQPIDMKLQFWVITRLRMCADQNRVVAAVISDLDDEAAIRQ